MDQHNHAFQEEKEFSHWLSQNHAHYPKEYKCKKVSSLTASCGQSDVLQEPLQVIEYRLSFMCLLNPQLHYEDCSQYMNWRQSPETGFIMNT